MPRKGRSNSNNGPNRSQAKPSSGPKQQPRNRQNRGANIAKRRVRRAMGILSRMSAAGVGFLKCAFASPDFAMSGLAGIPDGNAENHKIMVIDHNLLTAHAPATNTTTWYLVLPTPGVAYWSVQLAGTAFPDSATVWTPTYFPGAFGAGSYFSNTASTRTTNFSAFRYVSMCFEIKNTSNMMSYNGNITSWKTPVNQTINQITKTATFNTFSLATPPVNNGTVVVASNVAEVNLTGLDGTFAVPNNAKPLPFVEGVYTISTNSGTTFPFRPIEEGIDRLPTQDPGGTTSPNMDCVLNGSYLGCGNMEALIIRVVQPTSTVLNSAFIQSWACVEYKVSADSAFYSIARTGAKLDQLALDKYMLVAKQINTGYTSAENAGFWERVLMIIEGIAGAAAYAPGASGMLGAAVAATTSAVRRMAF